MVFHQLSTMFAPNTFSQLKLRTKLDLYWIGSQGLMVHLWYHLRFAKDNSNAGGQDEADDEADDKAEMRPEWLSYQYPLDSSQSLPDETMMRANSDWLRGVTWSWLHVSLFPASSWRHVGLFLASPWPYLSLILGLLLLLTQFSHSEGWGRDEAEIMWSL